MTAVIALQSLAAISCATQSTLHPAIGFTHALGRHHALVGRIFDSKRHAFSDPDRLFVALDSADSVVLGETHDNRDHHLLQAELLQRYLGQHAKAAVGFEMLDETHGAELARLPPATPDELEQRVDWQHSGWPPFALYRPIFAAALAQAGRIVVAHPSREHVRESMAGLSPDEASALHLDSPLPPAQQQAELDEIRASHCGHAPAEMLTPMLLAQVYKNAFMARALVQAGLPAVLIAGRGHARNDRGVPLFLHRFGVKSVLSVAFVEVEDDHTRATDYPVDAFDFVVFTPRVTDEDACERWKQQLKAMRRQ